MKVRELVTILRRIVDSLKPHRRPLPLGEPRVIREPDGLEWIRFRG